LRATGASSSGLATCWSSAASKRRGGNRNDRVGMDRAVAVHEDMGRGPSEKNVPREWRLKL
jgi:hypothetical protein